MNILVGFLASISYIIVMIFLNSQNILYIGFDKITPVNHRLLLIGVGISVGYIFFSLKFLYNHQMIFRISNYVKSIFGRNLLFVIAIYLIISFANNLVTKETIFDFTGVMRFIVPSSLIQPGLFIVAHTIYYGPVVIFCILYWKSFTEKVHKHGLGFIFAITVSLVFSVYSESRGHMLSWPLLIPIIAQIVDQISWKGVHFVLLGFLSILLSKVWLPFNNIYNPNELYFFHHGPWMKPYPYILNFVTVVILLQIILRIFPLTSVKLNKLLKS